ncbi:MAG TPA: hypothetical protein DCG75_14050 [Bacteroidales bacterium]|nr:hypothetical protein [Bacteroidales bacterium]
MKKAIKILLIIIGVVLIALVGIVGYFYVSYNNYSFNDGFQVNEKNLSYYNESYEEARSDFLLKSNEIALKYPDSRTFKIPVSSNVDTNLSIDFCYIRASQKTDKIFILSSGVHGVEGHVGSAVQLYFMDNYINDSLLNKTNVLLIHAVNPYGFKFTRRVTENNVDLNRNSDIDKDLFSKTNEGYPKVYDLINPEGKANAGSLANRFFFIKSIVAIAKESMPVLRQAVLQGQYEHPTGLYFGGKDFEPQIKDMVISIDTICDAYQTIFAIDLHTGYGERAKLHLFPNPVDEPVKKRMEDVFEGFHIDWGDSDKFYTYSGDFVTYIQKINSDKIFIPMLFEYGTMDSQTTIGSIKSLHTMILENQAEQYAYKSEEDREKIKFDFMEMYNPSSEAWRSHIIDETKIIFDKSLKRFTELEF